MARGVQRVRALGTVREAFGSLTEKKEFSLILEQGDQPDLRIMSARPP